MESVDTITKQLGKAKALSTEHNSLVEQLKSITDSKCIPADSSPVKMKPKAANLFNKEVKRIYTFFEANIPGGKRKKPAAESPKKAKKEVRFEINW